MSLQIAAQHMASRGRGPDTQLVHMAPQEVAGLQALAKAHGGSLSINPETGLAEAGFLSSILPTVIGAGLAATGVGAPMAALMVGGGMTLATGSLQKGLMAGLGAYGGAGLAGGLMGAGASAAGAGLGGTANATDVLLAQGAKTAGGDVLASEALARQALASGPSADMLARGAAEGMGGGVADTLTSGFQVPAADFSPLVQTVTQAPVTPVAPPFISSNLMPPAAPPTFTENLSQMGRGVESLGSKQGFKNFLGKAASESADATGIGGLKGLAQYGGAALAPVALDAMQPTTTGMPTPEKVEPRNYDYEYNMVENPQEDYTGAYTGERTYFNPTYTRMAEGGETGSAVKRVEDDPYYTMTGQSGDAYKYLMGQAPRPAAPMQPPASAPAPVQSQVQESAGTPSGVGSLFGSGGSKLGTLMGSFVGRATNGMLAGSQGQGAGSWQDAPGNLKTYSFDPATGLFTTTAAPQAAPSAADNSSSSPDFNFSMADYNRDSGGRANGGLLALAGGGSAQYNLGGYSDGGRLLRGPGNGTSDDIPAIIGEKQPARLADGEFVIPARLVSELGNGSTEAGARQLYAMMDRIQKARAKTTGKNKVAVDAKARNELPA